LGVGYETGRSKQASFPFTRDVTVDVIAAAGNRLWRDLIPNNATPMKVTSVQLGFTGLETAESGQRSLDGFLTSSLLAKRPRDYVHYDERHSPVGSVDTTGSDAEGSRAAERVQNYQSDTSFTCTRCGRRFSLPKSLLDVEDTTLKAESLAAIRMEHDDFHFAFELAKESDSAEAGRTMDVTTKETRKKRQKEKDKSNGIEKFFDRK
jgi:DNA polymerase eta